MERRTFAPAPSDFSIALKALTIVLAMDISVGISKIGCTTALVSIVVIVVVVVVLFPRKKLVIKYW